MCAELVLRMDRTDLAVKYFLLAGDKVQAADLLEQLGEHGRAAELFAEITGGNLDGVGHSARDLEAAVLETRN